MANWYQITVVRQVEADSIEEAQKKEGGEVVSIAVEKLEEES